MRDIESRPLLTTIAGSYPTGGLPPRRAIQQAIEDQIAAGIDLISDGQVRGDMVSTFATRIPGFQLANDGVWEIVDALDLPDTPIAVADYAFARQLAGARAELKGIVTGPITLALSSRITPGAPYTGPEDPALVLRLAEVLAREVAALVAAGAQVVQIDEPVLGSALGARISPELAEDALRDLAALPRLPALHVCGDIRSLASELLALPFAVLHIENTQVANLAALDVDELEFTAIRVCLGCVNTQDEAVEPVETVRERIHAALQRISAERLWIAPDCGMRLLSPASARAKLTRLTEAASAIRAELV